MKNYNWLDLRTAILADPEKPVSNYTAFFLPRIRELAVPVCGIDPEIWLEGCDVKVVAKNAAYAEAVGAKYGHSIFLKFADQQFVTDWLWFQNAGELRQQIEFLASALIGHAKGRLREGKWIAKGSKLSALASLSHIRGANIPHKSAMGGQ
jgi:hypothetical protein